MLFQCAAMQFGGGAPFQGAAMPFGSVAAQGTPIHEYTFVYSAIYAG